MNAGVSNEPWGVDMRPTRAAVFLSMPSFSNLNASVITNDTVERSSSTRFQSAVAKQKHPQCCLECHRLARRLTHAIHTARSARSRLRPSLHLKNLAEDLLARPQTTRPPRS